ncbi:hypothetical protein SDC9_153762 [bioreactor metagenome]|uniref:Uncharacterized protein n=1 Tax=bioreactor metagenome TaxID=1076179 RepID=A0A645EYK4_9ZZZZ
MPIETICDHTCYLLAVLNPASKVMFLASFGPELTRRRNFELSWKSSLAALLILAFLAATGQFLLRRVFRVELYSLQMVGGIVVFMIGWTAIRQGCFSSGDKTGMQNNLTDLSLVPLAAPLIAGPGMIAATIAGSVENGLLAEIIALSLAIAVNFVLMLFAPAINAFLIHTHLQGPLIRLTGLVIAAVAMQMIIAGATACLR